MSGIDDLIQELCPDGVEHTGVLDIADYVRGITYSKNDEDSAGEIQVLRANNITLASNTLNFEDVKRVSSHVRVRDAQRLRAGDTLICAGSGSRDHIGKVAYIREDIGQTFGGFMAVLRTTDARVESRFLFHLLTGERFKTHLDRSLSTSTINNLNASVMRGFRVPVPPLEVQREIVRVLDKFTQLEAELEAELEARKKQYEHYKSGAFEFPPETAQVQLGDLADLLQGFAFKSSMYVESGIRIVRISDVQKGAISNKDLKFYPESAENDIERYKLNAGDLVMSLSGSVGRVAMLTESDLPAALNQRVACIRPNTPRVITRYLFHYLNTIRFEQEAITSTSGGTVKNLSSRWLKEILIPIPSIDAQELIVSVLDKFDALVNDISIGLPAELDARRKQYEHYRDRLLTFKELTA